MISAPVRKLISFGARGWRSRTPGETTFAAMFTEMRRDQHGHQREEQPEDVVGLGGELRPGPRSASPYTACEPEVTMTDSSAKSVIVVGRPSAWPQICARWPAPKRVKSGMFSDSVDQKPIMPISDGKKTFQKSRAPAELGRLVEQRAEAARLVADPDQQHQRADDDEGRRPVLEAAQRLHAPVDDGESRAPRRARSDSHMRPRRGRRSAPAFAQPSPKSLPSEEVDRPRRRSRSGCRTSRRPPARPDQRGQVGAAQAEGGAGEDREGDAVLRSRVPGEQHRDQHDEVGQGDGEDRLLPVHAERRPGRRRAVQDGMLWAMPTHSAAKLYVVQVRFATGTGSRSSLAKGPLGAASRARAPPGRRRG